MTDMYQNVSGQMDPFKKLASYIPGFSGYVERQNRRDADKLVRDTHRAQVRRFRSNAHRPCRRIWSAQANLIL